MSVSDSPESPNLTSVFPFVVDWFEPLLPLPHRQIQLRNHKPHQLPIWQLPPPHWQSGPPGQPFDFCGHVRRLVVSVTQVCPEFRHIDVSQVLFTVTQARNASEHGLQARVTPMRFRGGARARRFRGADFRVQQFRVNGREVLYLMTFCLPRFLDLDFEEKLITVLHEMYHISPAFDGDLRRHDGRYAVHTHSKKQYDAHMAELARQYIASGADEALHAFLRLNFAQLLHKHGQVDGIIVPRPKLLRMPSAFDEHNPDAFSASKTR